MTATDLPDHAVARLIAGQFPHWAGLPVTKVRSAGTDNLLYRLGADLVVRLPRMAGTQVDDATWVRGQGWGLGLGLGAVHFYRATNPVLTAIGRHAIAETIADCLS